MAADKMGREWLVVVAKGTYRIPDHPEREATLLEEQLPLVVADVFTGEPGFSAPLYEIDFALRKPRCDVLLHGSAYAPSGRPAERVKVALKVGSLCKSFDVVGHRRWRAGFLSVSVSKPEPFTVMPISYNNAFGGIDHTNDDLSHYTWYPTNPVGVGYSENLKAKVLDGRPLPNTEATSERVEDPRGKYRPMAFGPIGRVWQPRPQFAGTYDEKWRNERYPFLPSDFDDRYFQCAPEDQQMDYLRGGEQVVLTNLTAAGHTEFKLPKMKYPFEFLYRNGERKRLGGVIDTLVLEPDMSLFTMSLRASLPLRRNLHEVRRISVGHVLPLPPSHDRAHGQVAAKPHYKSLADLVAANRAKGRPT